MVKKGFIILLIFSIFNITNLVAKVPQNQVDRLLKKESILSKEAINAYIEGKDIKKYLKDMKEINRHLKRMVRNREDIKHIIEYLNMEIDRVNLTYNAESLIRLHREIQETQKYIKVAMN